MLQSSQSQKLTARLGISVERLWDIQILPEFPPFGVAMPAVVQLGYMHITRVRGSGDIFSNTVASPEVTESHFA